MDKNAVKIVCRFSTEGAIFALDSSGLVQKLLGGSAKRWVPVSDLRKEVCAMKTCFLKVKLCKC